MIIPEEGLLLAVDKPKNWTSFDVVKKLRNALQVKKIGHAGTLDPLATGLLLIGVGRFTKRISEFQEMTKEYHGLLEIGKTTPSFDLETEFDSEQDWHAVSSEDLSSARDCFVGEVGQYPPAHSAVKIGGERAYSKARRNEEVELKIRMVTIISFELLEINLPEIRFQVKCSKGTYIRSLVSDFGQSLGVGAYLKELRRTRIGDYHVDNAYDLDSLITQIKMEREDR